MESLSRRLRWFWNEYQKSAVSLAVYPKISQNKVYPALGLIGEFGELNNQLKKTIRDDEEKITQERLLSIKKELGDILWYMATLSFEFEISMGDLFVQDKGRIKDGFRDIYCASIHCNEIASIVAKYAIENQNNIENYNHGYIAKSILRNLAWKLEQLLEMLGLSPIEIAEDNLKKLFSRKNRNAIKGDGDDR
jgi:NTP pyrophosphatase (non-canonical NTP hydrolase)